MMASVTSALRKALRQLEKERERIDRKINAIRSMLDESSTEGRAVPPRAGGVPRAGAGGIQRGGQVAWLRVHYLVSWDHHIANKE